MLHRVFPARRIRAGAFAATTALALSLAGCGQNTMTTGSLAPQASTNPQLARNQGILDKWAKAYKRDPENVQLALGYGQALAASGRSMEAAGVYAEALNHNPNHPELLAMYGRTLAREKPARRPSRCWSGPGRREPKTGPPIPRSGPPTTRSGATRKPRTPTSRRWRSSRTNRQCCPTWA